MSEADRTVWHHNCCSYPGPTAPILPPGSLPGSSEEGGGLIPAYTWAQTPFLSLLGIPHPLCDVRLPLMVSSWGWGWSTGIAHATITHSTPTTPLTPMLCSTLCPIHYPRMTHRDMITVAFTWHVLHTQWQSFHGVYGVTHHWCHKDTHNETIIITVTQSAPSSVPQIMSPMSTVSLSDNIIHTVPSWLCVALSHFSIIQGHPTLIKLTFGEITWCLEFTSK